MALSKAGLLDVVAITGETALADVPASTDELIINDGGTIKRIDFTHIQSHLVPISSVALTGNTNPVRFDDVFSTTYNKYQVILTDLCPQSDGVSVRFRFRDGSSTLESSNTYEHCSFGIQSDENDTTTLSTNNDDNIQIGHKAVGHSGATSGISGIIFVNDPKSSSNYANIHYDLKTADGDGFTLFKTSGAGAYKSATTAVEGFELTCSSNGFTSGRIDIFGVKNA
jgi:hypothetical protein|tara:strand:+ start:24 stop:701 length:678 start_codon:yes stop_codon:yes gene_type:complete